MRHYESNVRISQSDRVKIDGIGKPHVERRWQTELLANTDTENAAVHESHLGRFRGNDVEQRGHAIVLDGVTMHGGEETQRVHVPAGKRLLGLRGRVRQIGRASWR